MRPSLARFSASAPSTFDAIHARTAFTSSGLGWALVLGGISPCRIRSWIWPHRSRTERLATFGQLVGSIGHELRNPLGVIESSLYILKGRLGDDERAHKHTARIGEQLAIANQIISDLLDMIRDRPLELTAVGLSALLEDVVGSIPRPPGVEISIDGIREGRLGTLYRPRYFTNDGVAFHGSTSVPPYGASHGCVRLTNAAMDWVWAANIMPIGSPVVVY